jgi:hypothetical protein
VLAQGPPRPAGVDAEVEQAIQRGLAYLARTQTPSGCWRNAGGQGSYPAAMTGLAGMAFVAAGNTPTRGVYWREVRSAVDYLLRIVLPGDGLISVLGEEERPMYGHGFATLFLAQVYGMEEDAQRQQRIHRVLTDACALIARAQSAAGGWNYTPDDGGDEGSVTVTMVQALRACHNAGITTDKRTIDRAVEYVRKCQLADGSIRYSATSGGEGRLAITAAACAVLYNAGVYDDQAFVDKAIAYCKKHMQVSVNNSGHHFYAHLYFAQVLYQRGGRDWDDYFAKMSAWLRRQQKRDGAWDGDDVGPVYGTAVASIILQLPYALAPIYQR